MHGWPRSQHLPERGSGKAARKIYSGSHARRTGELIVPGYEPGSEANPSNWPAWITGTSSAADLAGSAGNLVAGQALQEFFGNGFFADFVFQNPNFDFRTLNFTTNVPPADNGLDYILHPINPPLLPFNAHTAQ